MQVSDDKKLSDLSKRFLQAISYCGLSGYKLKKDNIISSESTLTSIKKGIQLPSKKTIDAFCEKYDVSRAWLYTGEGLFAKTPVYSHALLTSYFSQKASIVFLLGN